MRNSRNSLQHVGVLGMHWGHHSSGGGVGIAGKGRSGKEIPTFKSVHGKPVQVDTRGRRKNIDKLKSDVKNSPAMKKKVSDFFKKESTLKALNTIGKVSVAALAAGGLIYSLTRGSKEQILEKEFNKATKTKVVYNMGSKVNQMLKNMP